LLKIKIKLGKKMNHPKTFDQELNDLIKMDETKDAFDYDYFEHEYWKLQQAFKKLTEWQFHLQQWETNLINKHQYMTRKRDYFRQIPSYDQQQQQQQNQQQEFEQRQQSQHYQPNNRGFERTRGYRGRYNRGGSGRYHQYHRGGFQRSPRFQDNGPYKEEDLQEPQMSQELQESKKEHDNNNDFITRTKSLKQLQQLRSYSQIVKSSD